MEWCVESQKDFPKIFKRKFCSNCFLKWNFEIRVEKLANIYPSKVVEHLRIWKYLSINNTSNKYLMILWKGFVCWSCNWWQAIWREIILIEIIYMSQTWTLEWTKQRSEAEENFNVNEYKTQIMLVNCLDIYSELHFALNWKTDRCMIGQFKRTF